MSNDSVTFGDRLAKYARLGLLAAIAVLAGMIISDARQENFNPLKLKTAMAEGAVTAAPGYLILSMNTGGTSKFYVADTTKQVLCVYEVNGDKLRLVGARKFDVDADVFDGSLPTAKNGRGIEGGNGITRAEAKEYGDGINKMFEDYKAKKAK